MLMAQMPRCDFDAVVHCAAVSDYLAAGVYGWLKATHAGTGFIHEAFHKDNPAQFTRSWFAWGNSLFGELIMKLSQEKPQVLGNL